MNAGQKHKRGHDRRAYLSALCRTVPYHVVEPVLANPTEHAICDRHFNGSLMFADLVGFTPLCERLATRGVKGLSQLSEILDQLFEQLLERGIFPQRGYVVQFGGDSVTVVFHDRDHARRCVASALTLQEIMHDKIARLTQSAGRELLLRIGLAAGSIALPVMGDLARRVVVCAGSTAHRALQMQQLAAPDQIIADSTLTGLLVPDLQADPAGEGWVIRGLENRPPEQKIDELEPRIQDHIEDKIALLEPFVPQPLALRLRSTLGHRLDGELREVAILFAEIWGFDQDDETGAFSTRIARSIPRTLHKYGGILSKVDLAARGHRIMALFGLASPSDNDAERAILAALEINSRLKSFTVDRRVNMGLRIGVHFGRVYFGAIGSAHKHDITAVGDAVNVAARTAAVAEPHEVLVTDDALEGLEAHFSTSPRQPLRVKGRSRPLRLFSIHGVGESRAHYVQRRRQQRFLAGRDAESQRLGELVKQAFASQPSIVGIQGEAGTGKSSLLSSLADQWIDLGGFGVLGRCRYANRSTPLAPIVTMFQNFLGFTENDSEAYRRDRIRFMLSTYAIDQGAAELVALLQPVQRPDGSTESLLDFADTGSRERVLSGILQFVRKRVEHGPLLYMLEDLQFADSLTLNLVQRIAALPRDRPFLFVGTYRPSPQVQSLNPFFSARLELKPLDPDAIVTLLCHELKASQVAPTLVDFFGRRTRGNPAYVVEVVRFLRDRQLIRVVAGTAVPTHSNLDLIEDAVPRTMAHVALARFDLLGEAERRLLRTAAAIGRRFRRVLIERVSSSELDPDLLESAMATLESQSVLARDDTEIPGFMFRDDAMRAVAYETIPEAERRQVHQRIADALERLPDPDSRSTATTLALHRERAGQLDQALHWYDQAIKLSSALAMDHETLELCQRWQRVLDGLAPCDQPTPQVRARMALTRLIATARRGASTATIAIGRELTRHHAAHLEPSHWAVVDYWLGDALANLGKPEKARARLEQAYSDAGDSALRCDAARRIAIIDIQAGHRQQAQTWLDRAWEMAQDDDLRRARIDMERGRALLIDGQADAAQEILLHVQRGAEQQQDLQLQARVTSELARVELSEGRFEQAQAGFEQAITLHRQIGDDAREATDHCGLGQNLLWAGRPDEARPQLETALAMAVELGATALIAEVEVHLGAALALTRDPIEGQTMCEAGYKKAVRADLREVEIAADLHLLRIAQLRADQQAIETYKGHLRANAEHLSAKLFQKIRAQLLPD